MTDVNIIVEPGHQDVMNVTFRQQYVSDNFRWKGNKQQLWRWGDGGWKIIYEGDN